MLELKSVFAKSPSLPPSPVKSNRRTAMPRAARARLMREAAIESLPQVKQCANSAQARGYAWGRSRRAARLCPPDPGKVTCSLRMGMGVSSGNRV